MVEQRLAESIDLTSSYYLRLRDDILAGVFPIGAQLLETALAQHYGISRTPMREALGLLEHDGLIERLVRGFRVRAGTAQDVMEIYEVRIALESAAASAAADRRTELDLAHLTRLHEQAENAEGFEEYRRLHSQWHEYLWQAGHNATIAATLHRVMAQLRIYDHGLPPPSKDYLASNADHGEILAACRDRDEGAAWSLMAAHLRHSRDERIQGLTAS